MLTTTTFINAPKLVERRPTISAQVHIARDKPVGRIEAILADADSLYQQRLAERRSQNPDKQYPSVILSGYWLGEDRVTIRYNDYGQAGRIDILYGAGGHVVIINNTITTWHDPARLPNNQDHL